MTTMRMEITNEGAPNTLTLTVSGNETHEGIQVELRDTDAGFEVKTTIWFPDGEMRVIQDKLDKLTPGLEQLARVQSGLLTSFISNSQAMLTALRIRRLREEGRQLTVQNTCLCGEHTSDRYDIPLDERTGQMLAPNAQDVHDYTHERHHAADRDAPEEPSEGKSEEVSAQLNETLARQLRDLLGEE